MSTSWLGKKVWHSIVLIGVISILAAIGLLFVRPGYATSHEDNIGLKPDSSGLYDLIISFKKPEFTKEEYQRYTAQLAKQKLIASQNLFEQLSSLEELPDIDVQEQNSCISHLSSRESLIAQMQINALGSQKRARLMLQEAQVANNNIEFHSYWLANSMRVVLTQELLDTLREFDEVAAITPNKSVRYDEAQLSKKRSRRSTSNFDPAKEIEANLKTIRADKVWNELGITGEGVLIGLVDQGVDISHPALVQHYAGYDPDTMSLDNSQFSYDAIGDGKGDSEPHGTHVAGILVGAQELGSNSGSHSEKQSINRIGVAPGAKFVHARAFRDGIGATNEAILRACQWIMAPGGDSSKAPRVVNHSWTDGTNTLDPWFEEMAQAMRQAGIFSVMSSGNNGPIKAEAGSIDNPAGSPLLFTVGASDNQGRLASFSRRGPSKEKGAGFKPDLVAPGYQVRSALAGGSYASWNGTSMAAPHVAATAALMLEADPSLTVESIEKILRETARPLTDAEYAESPNHGYGYGMLDAYAAVKRTLELAGKRPAEEFGSLEGKVRLADTAVNTSQIQSELSQVQGIAPQWAFVKRALPLKLKAQKPEDIHQVVFRLAETQDERSELAVEVALTQASEGSLYFNGELASDKVVGSKLEGSFIVTLKNGLKFESSKLSVKLIESLGADGFATDMKTLLPGFASTGDFKQYETNTQLDPPAQGENHALGLNPGSSYIGSAPSSTLQLPRIDLRAPELNQPDTKIELVYQEYADWSKAVVGMQAEEYPSKSNLPVFNYPVQFKTEGWQERRIDLSRFKGKIIDPFLFHLNKNGASDGYGLYIDNLSLQVNGQVKEGAPKFSDQSVVEFHPLAQEGQALEAKLELEGTGLVSYSKAPDGSYSFSRLPVGTYTLLVGAQGYGTVRVPLEVKAGDPTIKEIELSPDKDGEDTPKGSNDIEAAQVGEGAQGLSEYALDKNNPLGGALFTARPNDGVAISFKAHTPGSIDHLMVYVAGNNPASKDGSLILSLKQYNKGSRLIDLIPPHEVNLKQGQWNRIDLASYNIAAGQTEQYVVLQSVRPKGEGPAVGLDTSVRPGTQAYTKGYYYNGGFLGLKGRGYFGVPMIRVYVKDTSDVQASDPREPQFDKAISPTPVLDLIKEEGQAPKDIVTVGDWDISPSRGMIVKYRGLSELMAKPVEERILEIPAQIGGVSITSVGADALSVEQGRGDITRLRIAEGITEINEDAFRFLGMRELVLPSSLERVYGGAFQGARIKELKLPGGITYIGDNAFEGSDSLLELSLPDSLEELGRAAFKGASSLKKLHLPQNPAFVDVPASAFANTFALTEVEIPANVRRIKASAFDSSSLERIIFHEGLRFIDTGAFADTETLKDFELPDSLEEIGDDAFKNARIENLRLPASLKRIENGAFKKNKIRNIIFPEKLSFIDWDAFAKNPLETVRLNRDIQPRSSTKKQGLDAEAFGDVVKRLEVYSLDQVSGELRKNIVDEAKVPAEIVLLGEEAKEILSLSTPNDQYRVSAERQNLGRASRLEILPFPSEPQDFAQLKMASSLPNPLVLSSVVLRLVDDEGTEVEPLGPITLTVRAPKTQGIRSLRSVDNSAQVLPRVFGDHMSHNTLKPGYLDLAYRLADESWALSSAPFINQSFSLQLTRLPKLALLYSPLPGTQPIDLANLRYGWQPIDPIHPPFIEFDPSSPDDSEKPDKQPDADNNVDTGVSIFEGITGDNSLPGINEAAESEPDQDLSYAEFLDKWLKEFFGADKNSVEVMYQKSKFKQVTSKQGVADRKIPRTEESWQLENRLYLGAGLFLLVGGVVRLAISRKREAQRC